MRPWRGPLLLGLFAALLRLAVFATACTRHHIPVATYATKGDGASYIAYAKAICGDASSLTEYDRRVFPGYPALIALLHGTGLPFPWAALLLDWLGAGVSVMAAGALFADRRVAWAMVMLLPHYLTNSSLAMSESPLLALTLCGLLLARRDRPVAGGVVLGIAGLVRPMACFAVIGWVVASWVSRRWRAGWAAGIAAAVVVITGVFLLHRWTGDALQGLRIYRDSPQAYVGKIFAWPFESLVMTPIREGVAWPTIPWIWLHVAIVLLAIGRLARDSTRQARTTAVGERREPVDVLCLVWLAGNTLFVLCIGSGWGFRHFPRFCIPAEPAIFWALRGYLPRQAWFWLALALPLFLASVAGVAASS